MDIFKTVASVKIEISSENDAETILTTLQKFNAILLRDDFLITQTQESEAIQNLIIDYLKYLDSENEAMVLYCLIILENQKILCVVENIQNRLFTKLLHLIERTKNVKIQSKAMQSLDKFSNLWPELTRLCSYVEFHQFLLELTLKYCNNSNKVVTEEAEFTVNFALKFLYSLSSEQYIPLIPFACHSAEKLLSSFRRIIDVQGVKGVKLCCNMWSLWVKILKLLMVREYSHDEVKRDNNTICEEEKGFLLEGKGSREKGVLLFFHLIAPPFSKGVLGSSLQLILKRNKTIGAECIRSLIEELNSTNQNWYSPRGTFRLTLCTLFNFLQPHSEDLKSLQNPLNPVQKPKPTSSRSIGAAVGKPEKQEKDLLAVTKEALILLCSGIRRWALTELLEVTVAAGRPVPNSGFKTPSTALERDKKESAGKKRPLSSEGPPLATPASKRSRGNPGSAEVRGIALSTPTGKSPTEGESKKIISLKSILLGLMEFHEGVGDSLIQIQWVSRRVEIAVDAICALLQPKDATSTSPLESIFNVQQSQNLPEASQNANSRVTVEPPIRHSLDNTPGDSQFPPASADVACAVVNPVPLCDKKLVNLVHQLNDNEVREGFNGSYVGDRQKEERYDQVLSLLEFLPTCFKALNQLQTMLENVTNLTETEEIVLKRVKERCRGLIRVLTMAWTDGVRGVIEALVQSAAASSLSNPFNSQQFDMLYAVDPNYSQGIDGSEIGLNRKVKTHKKSSLVMISPSFPPVTHCVLKIVKTVVDIWNIFCMSRSNFDGKKLKHKTIEDHNVQRNCRIAIVESLWWISYRTSLFHLDLSQEKVKGCSQDVSLVFSDLKENIKKFQPGLNPTDCPNNMLGLLVLLSTSHCHLSDGIPEFQHQSSTSIRTHVSTHLGLPIDGLRSCLGFCFGSVADSGVLPSLFTWVPKLIFSLLSGNNIKIHSNGFTKIALSHENQETVPLTLSLFLCKFLKYSISGLSVMEAPSSSEQHSPELLKGMVCGLKALLLSPFSVLLFSLKTPNQISFHDALDEKNEKNCAYGQLYCERCAGGTGLSAAVLLDGVCLFCLNTEESGFNNNGCTEEQGLNQFKTRGKGHKNPSIPLLERWKTLFSLLLHLEDLSSAYSENSSTSKDLSFEAKQEGNDWVSSFLAGSYHSWQLIPFEVGLLPRETPPNNALKTNIIRRRLSELLLSLHFLEAIDSVFSEHNLAKVKLQSQNKTLRESHFFTNNYGMIVSIYLCLQDILDILYRSNVPLELSFSLVCAVMEKFLSVFQKLILLWQCDEFVEKEKEDRIKLRRDLVEIVFSHGEDKGRKEYSEKDNNIPEDGISCRGLFPLVIFRLFFEFSCETIETSFNSVVDSGFLDEKQLQKFSVLADWMVEINGSFCILLAKLQAMNFKDTSTIDCLQQQILILLHFLFKDHEKQDINPTVQSKVAELRVSLSSVWNDCRDFIKTQEPSHKNEISLLTLEQELKKISTKDFISQHFSFLRSQESYIYLLSPVNEHSNRPKPTSQKPTPMEVCQATEKPSEDNSYSTFKNKHTFKTANEVLHGITGDSKEKLDFIPPYTCVNKTASNKIKINEVVSSDQQQQGFSNGQPSEKVGVGISPQASIKNGQASEKVGVGSSPLASIKNGQASEKVGVGSSPQASIKNGQPSEKVGLGSSPQASIKNGQASEKVGAGSSPLASIKNGQASEKVGAGSSPLASINNGQPIEKGGVSSSPQASVNSGQPSEKVGVGSSPLASINNGQPSEKVGVTGGPLVSISNRNTEFDVISSNNEIIAGKILKEGTELESQKLFSSRHPDWFSEHNEGYGKRDCIVNRNTLISNKVKEHKLSILKLNHFSGTSIEVKEAGISNRTKDNENETFCPNPDTLVSSIDQLGTIQSSTTFPGLESVKNPSSCYTSERSTEKVGNKESIEKILRVLENEKLVQSLCNERFVMSLTNEKLVQSLCDDQLIRVLENQTLTSGLSNPSVQNVDVKEVENGFFGENQHSSSERISSMCSLMEVWTTQLKATGVEVQPREELIELALVQWHSLGKEFINLLAKKKENN